jgi:hypothetical protein
MKKDQQENIHVDSEKKKASSGHRGLRISKRDKEGIIEEEFNIGLCIKGVLAEEGRSVSWLANQMGCTREYLYKVFNRTWISTDLLVSISEAMRHDFFKDYSRTLKFKKKR